MANTLQIISAPQLSYILISWEPHWMNTEPGIPLVLNWCLKWMNILLAANAMSQAKLQRMSPTQTSIHLTCEDCGLHQKISDAKGNNRHLRVTANELRTWANSLVLVSSRKHTNLFFCPGSAAGAAALKFYQIYFIKIYIWKRGKPKSAKHRRILMPIWFHSLTILPGSAAGAAALKSGQGPPGRGIAEGVSLLSVGERGRTPCRRPTRSGQKVPRFTMFCALPMFSNFSGLVV